MQSCFPLNLLNIYKRKVSYSWRLWPQSQNKTQKWDEGNIVKYHISFYSFQKVWCCDTYHCFGPLSLVVLLDSQIEDDLYTYLHCRTLVHNRCRTRDSRSRTVTSSLTLLRIHYLSWYIISTFRVYFDIKCHGSHQSIRYCLL